MANKLLGQNFLKNPAILQKIVSIVDVQKNETVIEVGPGHGELTIPLAEACNNVGAKLIAVEKDFVLADALKNKISELAIKNLEIASGDVLEFLVSHLQSPVSSYKVVGNIPYYLTGHLLRVVSELKHQPQLCIFMVQKEVAERMIAGPHDMNRLAASVQFWSDPKIITRVSKEDFSPKPKVDSAVVALYKKDKLPVDAEIYFQAVRMIFAQPRKTILNNIAAGLPEENKEEIAGRLSAINVNSTDRPQDLSLDEIVRIAKSFV